ncbi:response regulator transcription factor [Methylobacillus gramineus]|uniref:response regulator n=1 Tax=Methylobacillus gramineus TaxID=755169 RepID=UPI001CFF5525|nr:response regulator transcription factor [Methylobacillus gramineus]MCB5184838.1 response regulator transcription factor [Methylobacillus gramineus]
MSAIIRVMLVDDHEVVRSGLRRLLEQSDGIDVIVEADSGEQAYQLYGEHLPDIVVMDMSMPGMGGLEALRRIVARYSQARVVIFSMHENAAFASQALSSGARAYVAKSGAADDLVQAVREVSVGKGYLSPGIAQKIALQSLSGDDDPTRLLSAREFEVFRLLAEGRGIEEIATILKISQKTVANYQTLLKQKLGISSPIELVRLAIRHGLIEG